MFNLIKDSDILNNQLHIEMFPAFAWIINHNVTLTN